MTESHTWITRKNPEQRVHVFLPFAPDRSPLRARVRKQGRLRKLRLAEAKAES